MDHAIRAGLIALAAATSLASAACSSAPARVKPAAVKPAPPPPRVPPAPAPPPPKLGSLAEALTRYRTWIHEARVKHPYPETEQRMYDVMICESGGKASIVNPAGPYSGLFQYSTATWNGAWNTYRDQGILDARAQFFATALAWQKGMQNQWGCYRKTR